MRTLLTAALLLMAPAALAGASQEVEVAGESLWEDVEGLDARVVSHGETFDIDDHLAEGRHTIFHFGAPWCGPCRMAEVVFRAELPQHPQASLRAVVLDGRTPKASFAHPVVTQYGIPGVPLILVVAPDGEPVYVGPDASAAIASLP